MTQDQNQPQNKIQLNVDPDKIESKYSDSAFINHNPFGFTFDFAQNIPQLKMLKIISRVSMSPQHTKALWNALGVQLKAYEQKFGEIKVTTAMQEEVDKSPLGFDVGNNNEE